jgi:2-oxoglutarate ferredoxin oxidoreductase subunit delta
MVARGKVHMKVLARTPMNLARMWVPRGQVYIIPERCKGCQICIRFCPQQVLQASKTTNLKGYYYPEVAENSGAACVHCEFCTLICPEFAIFTLPVEEALP